MARYQILSVVPVGLKKEVTIAKEPGFFARLLGAKTKTAKFWGSGSVWLGCSDGRRPGVLLESCIADLVAEHEMKQLPR